MIKDVSAIIAVAALLICGWLGKPVSVFGESKAAERINSVKR